MLGNRRFMESQSGLADSGKSSPPFGRLSVSTQRQSEASASDRRARSFSRALGLGLISGAADDDPSAIGTYAWAQQYLESHRDTLDHARESIGVVRETDFSSFNAVI